MGFFAFLIFFFILEQLVAEEQHRFSTVDVHTTRWWKNNKHRNKQKRNNQRKVSSLLLELISKIHSPSHQRKKTRTSGKLFSPACLPPMPVLFNDMIDSGRESVGRYQAKKIQCQDTVPDEWSIHLVPYKAFSSTQTTKFPGGGCQKLHQDT